MNPLWLTEQLWETTLDLMAPYSERGVEAGCFWYGTKTSDADLAMAVGIPRQVNHGRSFEIPSDALAELISALPPAGLVAVAQIHTHPGAEIRHSRWDDDLVVSRKLYSLVLPGYGRRPCPINASAIHAFTEGSWKRLPDGEVSTRILFTSHLIDTRG